MTQIHRSALARCGAVSAALLLTACAAAPTGPGAATHGTPVAVAAADARHPRADPGAVAAAVALSQVGQPYRYGGAGPGGFDCSGLVQYAYLQAGRTLPRTTRALWSQAVTVSDEALRPGDLLFFSVAGKMQHVGLYVGDERFVHAPSTGRTVEVESLANGYYAAALLRAGRPR